jgi:hypothetical protein
MFSTRSFRRRYRRLRLEVLEDRTLPSSNQTLALPGGPAVLLLPESSVMGHLGANETAEYQLNVSEAGRLIARVQADGIPTRLALYDAQGDLLVESDGQSPTHPDDVIDQHLDPAGTAAVYYLKVEGLIGASGSYSLTTDFQSAFPPRQPVPVEQFPCAFVGGDFTGDGIPDLAVANNTSTGADGVQVFLGTGDGTFQAGQLISLPVGSYPQALVAGDFTGDGRTDLAVVCSIPASTGKLQVLLGNGDGTFQAGQTISVGGDPDAVVAGDFRGNGQTDLAVADGDSGDVQVFLGNGDGTFRAGQTLTASNGAKALVAGNFTGDGRTDLAVLVTGSSDPTTGVQILLGHGNGTFQAGKFTTLPAVSYPDALVAGHFTGDGQTDLAVADQGSDDVQVLLGHGNGTFRAGQILSVGSRPEALVAGDFTGDGHTDLAVADAVSNDVEILPGHGDGTFRAGQILSVGEFPVALVAEDFAGDGRTDLAVADELASDVRVFLGDGNGTLATTPTQTVGLLPAAVVTGDFTGDNRSDLAVAEQNDVQILLSNGDGSFQAGQTVTAGGGAAALVTGDFNGDGRTDLAIAEDDANAVQVLLGNGDGTFRVGQSISLPGGSYAGSLVAGDFTGDGNIDLAVLDTVLGSSSTPADVQILLGKGDGTFRVGQTLTLPEGSYPAAVVAGDFTHNGRTDLAVVNGPPPPQITPGVRSPVGANGPGDVGGGPGVQVFLGNGDGTFQAGQTIAVGNYPVTLVAGDFTGDGSTDLAVLDEESVVSPANVQVLLGKGDGSFRLGQTITVPADSYPNALVAGDFTGDGRTDLAVLDQGSVSSFTPAPGAVQMLVGTGDGTFQAGPTSSVSTSGYPVALATGDFTGDDHSDLAILDQGTINTSGDLKVLLGNGDGTFGPASPQNPGPAPSQPFLVDLDRNGTADLVVCEQSGAILFRPGVPGSPGTFAPPVIVNPGAPALDMAIVTTPEGNRIAALDSSGSSVTLYTLLADGTFQAVQTLAVPGGNGCRIAADVQGDQSCDYLVVTTSPGNQILVYTQKPDGTFTGPTYQLATDAPPSDILFADVTGNGRQDIIACNPSASDASLLIDDSQQPFSTVERFPAGKGPYDLTPDGTAIESVDGIGAVLAGRFNEADPIDLLALSGTDDSVSLLRGTGVAGGFFARQVVLNLGFTAMQMVAGDFNGDGHLDLAFLDTQDDHVVVYLGDGTGKFTRQFSISAGRDPSGLSVADVNGDGIPDLLVASQTGDVLILMGKGDGTFRPSFSVHAERNLALASFTGSDGSLYFVSGNQAQNRVSVQDAAGTTTFTAGVANGLDGPSAVAVADLNGDGLPDLVVANSSSNQLLVFLGTGSGQFAPTPLAFPVGTNPAGITVANLITAHPGIPGDGIPDVVVANEGSNTLSVLFGQGQRSIWTLVNGPQLATGPGPVATVVVPAPGCKSLAALVVSNSQGNSISVLPSVGLGYFADNQAYTISTGKTGLGPGPLFLGHFGGSGLDLVTLNLQSNTLSYFADFPQHRLTATGPTRTLSSGGRGPVAAVTETLGGSDYSELIVANQSGTIAVFEGGPAGLTQTQTVHVALTDITALALGARGTLVVGGLGGVVTLPLEPAGLAGPEASAASPSVGAIFSAASSNPAPGRATVVAVATPPPASAQTSGTAGTLESSGTTAAVSSGSGLETVGGTATEASVVSLGPGLDLTPWSIAQGPAVREQVAASLLTGARPSARLLPQKGGASVAPVPSLTRDEEEDASNLPAIDQDRAPTKMVGFSYIDAIPPPRSFGATQGRGPARDDGSAPVPGQSRLPYPQVFEGGSVWSLSSLEETAETLALALVAFGGPPAIQPRVCPRRRSVPGAVPS